MAAGRSRRISRRLLRPPSGGQNNCRYDVQAEVNWGTRSTTLRGTCRTTSRSRQRRQPAAHRLTPAVNSTTRAAERADREAGRERHSHHARLGRQRQHRTRNGRPGPAGCGGNPCEYNGAQDAHQTFVGTTTTAGAVALVRTSPSGSCSPVRAVRASGPPARERQHGGGIDRQRSIPTVGIRTVLKPGILTTIRLDDPQANQTLRCDPNLAQGQEFSAFRYGCQPWYAKNKWASPWWNIDDEDMPAARPCSSRTPTWATLRQELDAELRGSASRRRRASRPARSGTTSASRRRTAPTSTTTRASSSGASTTATTTGSRARCVPGDPGWLYRTETDPPGAAWRRRPAGREPVRHPVPVAQGVDRRRSRRRPCPILDVRVVLRHELDGQQHQPERPVPGPRHSTPTAPGPPRRLRSPTRRQAR